MLARRRSLLLPALLGVLVLSLYIFTAPNDLQHNGDTWLRVETTQAIVDHGHIWVAHPVFADKRMVHGVDNRLYTIYDPGQIVAMIPLYIAGKFLAHHFTHDYFWTPMYTTHMLDDIFGALLAIVFFLIALRLGYSRRVAALLTLIFAFASVAWPDAESMLEHTQVTFFLLLAVLFSLTFVQQGIRQRYWILGAGLALGCAFLTRYDTGVLLPIIPLYLAAARLSRGRLLIHPVDPAHSESPLHSAWRTIAASRRDLHLLRSILADWTVLLIALAPIFGAAGAWNYARFGSVTATGIPPTFGEPILQGLAGLTLSPGKGLIWYMPILFVLPFVVRQFYRQHRLTTAFFAAIVLTELLLFSTVIYWHGDPAWGPRYIFSTAPFLVLPIGIVLERWAELKRTVKVAFLAVLVLSFSVQIAGTIAPQYRFWYREIHAQLAARQGFNWGYRRGQFWYFYYWNINRNPILISYQNLYQITALRLFGQEQYNLQASPIPRDEHLNLANPVHNYEINNYNVWWLGTYNPLFGTHRDAIAAIFWMLFAGGSGFLLWRELKAESETAKQVVVELKRRPA